MSTITDLRNQLLAQAHPFAALVEAAEALSHELNGGVKLSAAGIANAIGRLDEPSADSLDRLRDSLPGFDAALLQLQSAIRAAMASSVMDAHLGRKNGGAS